MGCTIAHSVSVRSLGLRKPLRSATRRCSGFHIGRSPENQAPNKESHPIHQTQELPGSALKNYSAGRQGWRAGRARPSGALATVGAGRGALPPSVGLIPTNPSAVKPDARVAPLASVLRESTARRRPTVERRARASPARGRRWAERAGHGWAICGFDRAEKPPPAAPILMITSLLISGS